MTRFNNDAYFTPEWLADQVASVLPEELRGRVVDPTSGDGALLSAVVRRFGDAVQPLAIDVDSQIVATVRREHPEWIVSCADLLNRRSRNSSVAWRAARRNVECVLLNPPFSYRGNAGRMIRYGSFQGRVAPALDFLLIALRELDPAMGFVAILPNGAVEAERHREVWREILSEFTVERLVTPSRSSFRGARVATIVVKIQRRSGRVSALPMPHVEIRRIARAGCVCVELIRGRVPVYRLPQLLQSGEMVPFFHTTSFRQPADRSLAYVTASLSDDAPLVILPRVGQWCSPVALEVGRVVLSDCVIGLRSRDRSQFASLHEWLTGNSAVVRSRYRGTGAPYLTLASVVSLLDDFGWHPHIVKAGAALGACCCDAGGASCSAAVG